MQTRPNYIILDGAKMQLSLDKAKELSPQHQCLFQGNQAEYMGLAAPWVFTYSVNAPIAKWLYENGKGQNWGIYFYSQESFETIYKHLLQLLLVNTLSSKQHYFRYYDPRVLNNILPECTTDQIHSFLGPIASFFSETTDGHLRHYKIHPNQQSLNQENIAWEDFFQKGGIRIIS